MTLKVVFGSSVFFLFASCEHLLHCCLPGPSPRSAPPPASGSLGPGAGEPCCRNRSTRLNPLALKTVSVLPALYQQGRLAAGLWQGCHYVRGPAPRRGTMARRDGDRRPYVVARNEAASDCMLSEVPCQSPAGPALRGFSGFCSATGSSRNLTTGTGWSALISPRAR
jgi:hypothetical protein